MYGVWGFIFCRVPNALSERVPQIRYKSV